MTLLLIIILLTVIIYSVVITNKKQSRRLKPYDSSIFLKKEKKARIIDHYTPPLIELGITEPVCPNCGVILSKMPGAKTKCKDCGKYLYVRTRPIDNKRILVKEEEIELVEEQWAIFNGEWSEYEKNRKIKQHEFDKATDILTKKFGHAPSKRDIDWYLLNRTLIKNARDKDYSDYRNTSFQIAKFLLNEKRKIDALNWLLIICYLDAYDLVYAEGISDHILIDKLNKKETDIEVFAPWIINKIYDIFYELKLSENDLNNIYYKTMQRIQLSLKIPISIDLVWQWIISDIKSGAQ